MSQRASKSLSFLAAGLLGHRTKSPHHHPTRGPLPTLVLWTPEFMLGQIIPQAVDRDRGVAKLEGQIGPNAFNPEGRRWGALGQTPALHSFSESPGWEYVGMA